MEAVNGADGPARFPWGMDLCNPTSHPHGMGPQRRQNWSLADIGTKQNDLKIDALSFHGNRPPKAILEG